MQWLQLKVTLGVNLGLQDFCTFYLPVSWFSYFSLPLTAPRCPAGLCCKSHLGLLRPQNLFLAVL